MAAAAISANAAHPMVVASLPLRYCPISVRSAAMSITRRRKGAAAMPLMIATSTSNWMGLV